MKIVWVRHIDGPNVYTYRPVLVARVDLGAWTERESYSVPGFPDRLLQALPGLREHHCAKGQPGGFVERLYSGTYFGHVLEHVALELASLCGLNVHFGKTLYAGRPGQYDVVMECEAFECQRYLLERAVDVVAALAGGCMPDIRAVVAEGRVVRDRTGLGPSTQAIVDAARRRNIPVRRLSEGSLIQLGYGCRRKWVAATLTAHTSAVSVDIACDKALTKQLLAQAGVPVPEGEVASSLGEALEAFARLGPPVVVKPLCGNQGKGVTLGIQTAAEVEWAYGIALRISDRVLVERQIPGRNIRALVVGGVCVAASERIPARVVGDGVHTVRQLVEQANLNPLRGVGHEKPLTRIALDDIAMLTMQRQGWGLDDVPEPGRVVLLRDSANLSTGGEAVDVTAELHPSCRELAERAARIIGLDVCGIDLIVPSLSDPVDPHRCAVIEVNAAPGIRMHQHPSVGQPRDAGDAIVASLFPAGDNGRIPIVSITGTNGKTTTTRLIAHAVAATGKVVGMTTTGGVYIGGRKVLDGDTTGPDSARVVLSDPLVEVAVLETARGGIVRGGLAYDKANVAVITNITLDHVGQDGAESLEDILHIKSLVAECVPDDGVVVLNADDEHLVALARRLRARVVFFSASDHNPVLKRHLACGGVGYYVSRGWLMEGRGNLTWEVVPVSEIPLTMRGTAEFQVENCLAALSALRALGLTRQQIAAAFTTFTPSRHNVGRLMLYELPGDRRVVLDYGHNPDGFAKMGRWLARLPHRRLIGVVGMPGDRADHVIREGADALAPVFDGFVIKEDADLRGRAPGEVARLMAEQIRLRCPEKPCMVVLPEREALQHALSAMEPGDVVVAFYEKLAPLEQLIRSLGGVPADVSGEGRQHGPGVAADAGVPLARA
ncbi:MAG: cyanophycin synthetase [Alicyclobacillus sp.]|nr:cyanophycin synthetase [Alicyclobacillus sp.]